MFCAHTYYVQNMQHPVEFRQYIQLYPLDLYTSKLYNKSTKKYLT